MTDKKLTDEEIIEVLMEDLIAATNRYSAHLENGGRIDENQEQYIEMLTETINLINRQKAEIERLKSANDEKFRQWNMLAEKTKQHYADLYNEAKDILKVEAYKEFAERLKKEWFCNGYDSPDVDFDDFIVNLLKEMVGEGE